jgi:hypothetical protein
MSTTLSPSQVLFLVSQNIPLSRAFDASGYSKKEYSEIMKEEDMLVAYNTTPCNSFSHTLRSRHGHCIQCNTQALAFIRRYSEKGLVYLLHSVSIDKCKIGTCKDINERLRTLNSQKYGGANDWLLVYCFEADNSARVEYSISRDAAPYRFEMQYTRTGKTIKCQEIYSCSISKAKEIINNVRQSIS